MDLSINTGIVTLRVWITTKKKSTLGTIAGAVVAHLQHIYLHIETTKVLLLQGEYHLQELDHKKVGL